MKYGNCLLVFFLTSTIAIGCFGPQPWVDDYAVMPTDQAVWDIPIPGGFEYLETRSFAEEDPVHRNRYVQAYYRGETSPNALAVELEREMVKLKWKLLEKAFTGNEHTLKFGKKRPGGDDRRETCEIAIWILEKLTFVKFKISPVWQEKRW
ncbi:MAG: hypothetical protein E3J72_17070 [Planctomycetota bacterium]|nr:MAG: hypothetical protein E3J72_17070 [Planctomycetota bacterium]